VLSPGLTGPGERLAPCALPDRPVHDDGRRHSGPGLAGKVAFSEWTADGSMQHPGWHGLRAGKDPRQVHRDG
jgi:ATP-dependent DNA ligase